MLNYRLETVTNGDGMISVQAYSGDGSEPCASSGAIFHTEAEADAGIRGMFDAAWPSKNPFAVDTSIGV